MVHPIFKQLPDKYIAEAFSEMMEPGQYKFIFDESQRLAGQDSSFPPEPAYFTTVTGAFIARNGTDLRRFGISGLSGTQMNPKHRDAVDAYKTSVGKYQEALPAIEQAPEAFGLRPTRFKFGAVGEWAVEATQRAQQRLVAAHVICLTRDGSRLIDSIVTPTLIDQEFPLLVRQLVEPIAEKIREEDEIEEITVTEELKSFSKDFMTNSGLANKVSGLAPASVLPTVPQYSQALRAQLK